jgi:adenylate kinase
LLDFYYDGEKMKLLIMGPPGVGKGTQAKIIKDKLRIAHISTGELLRQEIAKRTEVGIVAKKYIDQGKLVPDNFLFTIVNERLGQPDCRDGYILDGFPRTLNQANGLETIMGSFDHSLDRAISLYADEDALVERLVKRGENSGRSDDTSNIIRNRQKIYWQQTAPLLDFYEERGLLDNVNGLGEIKEITERILTVIK